MNRPRAFHIVTVGWERRLVEGLCDPVAAKSAARFSHIVHPSYVAQDCPDLARRSDIHFFRSHSHESMPDPDPGLLASLERPDIPTIHNMILGDRVVSKIDGRDALRYATFLVRRLIELYRRISPDVIIGAFDALHGGLALAAARHLNIPWFALNFSVIPPGLACFCDRMSPAARVSLTGPASGELREIAEGALRKFETRDIQAHAFIAPQVSSLPRRLSRLPARFSALTRTIRNARDREYVQFTQKRVEHDVWAALEHKRRAAAARRALSEAHTLAQVPDTPYVLFGLHLQPESSIDVWAPFFSNQIWVIELLARSIPPSHKLLVKIHKSDVANYSREQLERMQSFPGVELVRPFADTRSFIERADLVVSIQGTMGLEAALLGKPVIMLGDSPVSVFPSASPVGEIVELPMLVRSKLAQPPPGRDDIVAAYADYLAPFMPASLNDWSVEVAADAIERYVQLFSALERYVRAGLSAPLQVAL
ncbi:MAG TPA: DUF354 domain-containing protein [Steroidobacter sp.]|uniref:capsular polysaccharide export protein, LipB/KpsS family n=1 Tax=Steroidobacter sp. TaxID=1978227 RepID=UPI002EDBAC6E